ncbi:hypothetical protein [Streptomyces sp. AS58]|uniref:hypothetical protein n=1 Tax=Streptomyces sp. AS58 TaxID=1519489 RepID=UPI000B0BE23B|nr:hypothetical protein [Streptomyces sp. AS58]
MSGEAEAGRGSGSVPVQYHQFDVGDQDAPVVSDLDHAYNGLVRIADGTVIVMTS